MNRAAVMVLALIGLAGAGCGTGMAGWVCDGTASVGGGGNASTWAEYPATQDIDGGNHNAGNLGIVAAESITLGGVNRSTWPAAAPGSWVPAPAGTNAPGSPGEMAYSNPYFYVCVATNVWRRLPALVW